MGREEDFEGDRTEGNFDQQTFHVVAFGHSYIHSTRPYSLTYATRLLLPHLLLCILGQCKKNWQSQTSPAPIYLNAERGL